MLGMMDEYIEITFDLSLSYEQQLFYVCGVVGCSGSNN
jgi:hypothetical protein